MKEAVSVIAEHRYSPPFGLSEDHLNELAVQNMARLSVSPNKKTLILSDVPGGDGRLKEFLDRAVNLGVDVWHGGFPASGWAVIISRKYDEADLAECRHFHSCDADSTFLGEVDYPMVCDSIGIPALRGKPRQKVRNFGTPEPLLLSFFVARGPAKQKLEDEGFIGLQFHPIHFNRVRSLQPEDQLWAVWSDLVLPPVKNLFRGGGGEMGFANDVAKTAKNMGPAQGFLLHPELHYHRSQFEELGDFDVALMAEPVIHHGTYTKNVIFSQRFRRFVIDELGVPFSGFPVRLDDDDIIPWEGPYPSAWAHLNRRPEWLERLQEEVSRRGRH